MTRAACTLALCLLAPAFLRADDWPQWLGPRRDGVWRETAILERFPTEGVPAADRQRPGPG